MQKNKLYHLLFLFLVGCLLSGLSACGGSSVTNTNTIPALQTYDGKNFTISYPRTWKVEQTGEQVAFIGDDGSELDIQVVSDVTGIQLDDAIKGGLNNIREKSQNVQDKAIPQSRTVSDIFWKQGAVTSDLTDNNQTINTTTVIMASHNPRNTMTTGVIVYFVESSHYDELESTVFTPMINSFRYK